MSILVKFITNIESTIADSGGISDSDTTFDLNAGDGSKLPTLGTGEYIYGIFVDGSSNWEIVKVTAVSTDTCTITRGQGSTTPRAFSQNDVVYFPMTHCALEDIVAAVATLTGTETLTNKTLTAPIISGGTVDNAIMGGSTPAAGTFTALKANSDPTDATGVGDRGFNDTRYPYKADSDSLSAEGSTSFTGLTAGTRYKLRWNVVLSGGDSLSATFNADTGANYDQVRSHMDSTDDSSTGDSAILLSQADTYQFGELEFCALPSALDQALGYAKNMNTDSEFRRTGFYYDGSSDVVSVQLFTTGSETMTGTVTLIAIP